MPSLEDAENLSQIGAMPDQTLLGLLQVSPDCVKLLEPDGSLGYVSQNGLCAMEIPEFDVVKGLHWPGLWPEEARGLLEEALASARKGNMAGFVADCPTYAGTPKRWEVTLCPILEESGQLKHILSVSRDVTGQEAYPPSEFPLPRAS